MYTPVQITQAVRGRTGLHRAVHTRVAHVRLCHSRMVFVCAHQREAPDTAAMSRLRSSACSVPWLFNVLLQLLRFPDIVQLERLTWTEIRHADHVGKTPIIRSKRARTKLLSAGVTIKRCERRTSRLRG